MIKEIVTYINQRIESLNMFRDIKGLCELITVTKNEVELTFPAEYCQNEYKHIDFDTKGSIVYHRLNGNIESEELDEEQAISCEPFIQKTFPMRTICYVKKDVFGKDQNNAYIDTKIAENVINEQLFNNKDLAQSLQVDTVEISNVNVIYDRDDIFSEEYAGIDNVNIPYEYSYIAIEYNIVISAQLSCFKTYSCNGNN